MLVEERKLLPGNYESCIVPKPKKGHAGCELAVAGANGNRHMATERYQKIEGKREETFAVVTDRFADWRTAVDCLIEDCGVIIPEGAQPGLFSTL